MQSKIRGRVGHCWAFATVEAVESALFLVGLASAPPDLATQPLLDCDSADSACDGGNPATAIAFLAKSGDCLDKDYPYQAARERCTLSKAARVLPPHELSCAFVEPDSSSLEEALLVGPVIAGVAADSHDFKLYESGVFDGNCGDDIDHAVSVVGFSRSYWIIRNSWGLLWGENGFMRMSKSAAPSCGLLLANMAVAVRPPPVLSIYV